MRFAISKEEDEEEEDGQLPVFHTSCDIFIHFLYAVTFSHVLHLDVLESEN